MKKLITIATLALCASAAFAEVTPSQVAEALKSNDATYDAGYFTGLVTGFAVASGNKICTRNAVVGAIEYQVGADIETWIAKHPDRDKPMDTDAAQALVYVVMQTEYPCK